MYNNSNINLKTQICMRKILLSSLLCISAALMASDICIDGIWYKFHGNEAEVTYKGTGSMDYNKYSDRYVDSLIIPETVTYESKIYTVTSVDSGAARLCQNLTYLELPKTIKKIECGAFYFTTLKEITIPDGVEEIESYAFGEVLYTKIRIGKGLKKVNINAIAGSWNLSEIIVDPCNPCFTSGDNCNALIERATGKLVLGCINTHVPSYVKTIGYLAFYWCKNLTNIELPCVETIEAEAFSYCTSLEEITFGKQLTSIGSSSFTACLNLSTIISQSTTPPVFEDEEYGFGEIEEVCPQQITVLKGYKGTYEAAVGWSKYSCYEEVNSFPDPTIETMPDVECPETDLDEFIAAPTTTKSKKFIQNGCLYITTEHAVYNAFGNVINNN